jgi:hypothetical protein
MFLAKNYFHQKNQKLQFEEEKKLRNLYCDEPQRLKLCTNAKTQLVMKLKNSNCDETQKLKLR